MRDELQLRVDGLRGGYGDREIIHGVSFTVDTGDVLCILGPNGCGKSTLLKLMLRIHPKTGGAVFYRSENVDSMSRRRLAQCFSYIPQSGLIAFPYTALEIVTMARTSHIAALGSPKEVDIETAMRCLLNLKLGDIAYAQFNELSGGQRQLILIARALCQGACIMFMDEPVSNLDFANQKLINDAVRMIADEGKIVVICTHSPSQPFEIANKALLLNNGNMAGFGATDEVITAEALTAVYRIPMEIVTVTDQNQKRRKICLDL